MALNSQGLDQFEWKNRVLLINGEDPDAKVWIKQREAFKVETKGLKERKVVLVYVEGERCRIINYMHPDKQSYIARQVLDQDIKWSENTPFEVIHVFKNVFLSVKTKYGSLLCFFMLTIKM